MAEREKSINPEREERRGRVYGHARSKKARGEEKAEPAAERKSEEPEAETAEGDDGAVEVTKRHAGERKTMHSAHEAERRDMHNHHRGEHRAMNARHEKEHEMMNKRHEAEMQQGAAGNTEAGEGTAGETGTAAEAA